MKTRLLRIACVTFCVILTTATVSFAFSDSNITKEEPHQISEPYEYPVVPGTEAWKSLKSHDEMVKVCNVPDTIVKRMTTEALFETIMTYPLLYDMLCYSSFDQGYEMVKGNCSSMFDEFFSRPDAESVINAYEKTEILPCTTKELQFSKTSSACLSIMCNSEFDSRVSPCSTGIVTNNNVKTPK